MGFSKIASFLVARRIKKCKRKKSNPSQPYRDCRHMRHCEEACRRTTKQSKSWIASSLCCAALLAMSVSLNFGFLAMTFSTDSYLQPLSSYLAEFLQKPLRLLHCLLYGLERQTVNRPIMRKPCKLIMFP